jgi:outer membrane biosynthesis protein TonB
MPLTARLSVQAINEINAAIAAIHRSDPGRDLEVGGILLGAIDSDEKDRPAVRIERFDPVSSEHRRGSSYVLSERDKKVLAKKIEWWNRHVGKEGLQPVGFFRSHTRRGLYVDNEDFGLLQHFFPEPAALFLLVRPTAGADSVGGFFFWEDGDMHRESSYQEFPFHADHLPLTAPELKPEPAPEPIAPLPVAAESVEHTPAPPVKRPAAATLPPRPLSPRPVVVVRISSAWAHVAIPLVIGMVLGAGVFGIATRGSVPQKAETVVRPSGAKPVAQAPAEKPIVVEKPSPLEAKSRPVAVPDPSLPPAQKPLTTADRAMSSTPAANPRGSTSRTAPKAVSDPVREVVEPAHAPAPAPAPPPAQVAASTPPPAASIPMATVSAPLHVERPHRPASLATVTVEPVSGSKIGRVVSRIPGFRRRKQAFIPARPIRQVAPSVPADEQLARDVPVDLRITVDPAGNVSEVEQASRGADKELVRLASDAARSWHFVPARRNDETVTSELILHFTFPGSQSVP